jgi:hypothetical protein
MFIPILTNAIQEQNQLITTNSNNISLNATATSVSQLQTLVEQEFTNTTGTLNQVQDDILDMQEEANILVTQTIPEIESNIIDLQKSLSILDTIDTRVLALNVDELMFINSGIISQSVKGENGLEAIQELTLEGLLNVDKIIADEIDVEKITAINNIDSPRVGESVVPEGNLEIIIETDAVSENSKVFVTVKDADRSIFAHVENIIDGESFVIGLNKISDDDVSVDWWIVDMIDK